MNSVDVLVVSVFYSIVGFIVYVAFRTVMQDALELTREQDHAYSLLAALLWPLSVPGALVWLAAFAVYKLCRTLVESAQVISKHLEETMRGDQ